uniref:Spermatogenesis associated 22 n=1 Tax=Sphaeramia orbicularis TaxID=375764 RepID=A0A673A7B7_9TELE
PQLRYGIKPNTLFSGLSVPLFNQKKRNRVPLTSVPSDTDFFSHREYRSGTGHDSYRAGIRPAPSHGEYLAQTGPDPYRIGMGPTLSQGECLASTGSDPYRFGTGSASGEVCSTHFSHWVFGPQPTPSEAKTSTRTFHTSLQMKPSTSLRILTATIDGMRHWSQFRDKVPILFEICATLDSAVTLGSHGAKNFLLRDGKEVVQCVYYENEQGLPRLIRGQVHRCVGNYDCGRNVLTCVSVRAGHPSELRNAHEAVRVCDAEMRAVVKAVSEV